MNRKFMFAIMLTIVFIFVLGSLFEVQNAEAMIDCVYIRADGSVDPPIAAISTVDNITYNITANLSVQVAIERSNIVIDGSGHTLQRDGTGIGMNLTSVSNVTIKNVEIGRFQYGIRLEQSSNINLFGNIIKDSWCGIWMQDSSNNSISEGRIKNNTYGVWIFASGNTIFKNTITNNTHSGVVIDLYSSNNIIYENRITNNTRGAWLIMASDNKLYHNSFIDNTQHVDIPWFGYANIWDDGYPSGGNYWSGYACIDLHSGSYQNATGRDGIGDSVYIIDADNTDHYPFVTAYSPIYQGDLFLTDNDVYAIEGRFDINGSVIVEENATLILRNALLNLTQEESFQFGMVFRDPSNGNPKFIVENSTLTTSNNYYINIDFLGNSSALIDDLTVLGRPRFRFGDDSVATLSNSSLYHIYAFGNSTLNIFNCTIHTADNWEDSDVQILNSIVTNYVDILVHSINCSVSDLKSGLISYWNFRQNCAVEIAPNGYAPNFIVQDTLVMGWWFDFHGFSNVTISGSELEGLGADHFAYISFYNSTISSRLRTYGSSKSYLYETTTQELDSYDNSNVWLVNSTCNNYNINYQSRVFVSWYLDVHVIDSIGQNVPSANVTATYPNATVAESKSTDANGWTRLTLMEKMMNATGEYPVGNYTVEATYESYSDDTTVNMTENKQITLTLEEFPSPDNVPPTVSVISPEYKTYTVNHVQLTFTVSESTSWIGYCLDGQENQTITGNVTLSDLSEGMHSLTVYAEDTAGNTGASEIVYFSIETPEPFPMWIVATILIVIMFGATLLVYFTRAKKTTERTK